ncbi:MAG: hypothetical protein AAGA68_24965 [Pseudomonadota bacterium]
MGLDIRYCAQAWFSGNSDYDSGCGEVGMDWIRANPDFPEVAADLKTGWYMPGQKGHFDAGSYGSYNRWREQLCGMVTTKAINRVWLDPDPELPFISLICFTDCDGVVGPKACATLARQFAEHEHKLSAIDDERFCATYRQFKKAFEVGAESGYVLFT